MAKKQKGHNEPTAQTTVPSKDVLQRLSYLYQASVLLANVLPFQPATKDAPALIPTQVQQPVERPADLGEGTSSRDADVAAAPIEGPAVESGPSQTSSKRSRKLSSKKEAAAKPVSRLLIKTMNEVAKKATLRMDPTVKRTMCKGCSTVLVSGVTSTVRVKRPHAHIIVHTCRTCKTRRRLPAPPVLPDEDAATGQPSEIEMGSDNLILTSKQTKKEGKESRQARRPVFFERSGHLTFAGAEQVVQDP